MLKLYFDLLSQPSRAVVLFVRAAKIPCEEIKVSLIRGQHKRKEYAEINRFKKVPCIVHNDLHLSESVAIFRYLCSTFPVADHWYPKNSQKQARIDEFLEWQHGNLRANGATFLVEKFMKPIMSGRRPHPSKVDKLAGKFQETLDLIENIWLKDSKFIAGSEISVADLLAVTELITTTVTGYDIFKGRPNLTAYMGRVQNELEPHYTDLHKRLPLLGLIGRTYLKIRFLGKAP